MGSLQNKTGRAFEYGIAIALSKNLLVSIKDNAPLYNARRCFEFCSNREQERIVKASNEITAFLIAHDTRLIKGTCYIFIQSDQQGEYGDVRDVIIHNIQTNENIGISAKNRHFAVKHSRLSEQIDFGAKWLGVHCSENYFKTIVPIFRDLNNKKRKGEQWKNIPNKQQLYYMPVLQAFKQEMQSLLEKQANRTFKALMYYLLGKYDYYKIIKENGSVSIISFNMNGTLKWGNRVPLPTRIIEVAHKPDSETTLFLPLIMVGKSHSVSIMLLQW